MCDRIDNLDSLATGREYDKKVVCTETSHPMAVNINEVKIDKQVKSDIKNGVYHFKCTDMTTFAVSKGLMTYFMNTDINSEHRVNRASIDAMVKYLTRQIEADELINRVRENDDVYNMLIMTDEVEIKCIYPLFFRECMKTIVTMGDVAKLCNLKCKISISLVNDRITDLARCARTNMAVQSHNCHTSIVHAVGTPSCESVSLLPSNAGNGYERVPLNMLQLFVKEMLL